MRTHRFSASPLIRTLFPLFLYTFASRFTKKIISSPLFLTARFSLYFSFCSFPSAHRIVENNLVKSSGVHYAHLYFVEIFCTKLKPDFIVQSKNIRRLLSLFPLSSTTIVFSIFFSIKKSSMIFCLKFFNYFTLK